MAKTQYIDYKKMQQELFKRTEGYAAEVRAIYLKALGEVINLVKGTELEPGKPFSFSEYGYSEEVTPILRKMYSETYQVIRSGVQREWLKANENNDGLVKAVFGASSINDHHFSRFFARNMEAMDAFFARKTEGEGLNLSQRVWRYTGMYKTDLENTLDLAIGEGTPAARLASKIQSYLQEPDRFYRRFRVKVGEDEEGNPIYGRIWKRRVYDAENQQYKWVNEDRKKYHPGRGIYRSSYRNAQRLARSETNIAYRTADHLRWQELDFVIGQEVKLSNNHPEPDICDDLKGVYPKDFKFTGWHPNCRCYVVPVLAKEEELEEMLDNILDGEDPGEVECEGEVKQLPSQFTGWISDNQERIDTATAKGTLPYFIRDNQALINPKTPTPKEIGEKRHAARTEEEAQAIKARWYERKAVYHYGQNILNIMGGIPDVSTTALEEALRSGNQAEILAQSAQLKAIGKEIYALDKLADPMAVAKQYGFNDAKGVQNAVTSKLDKWAADYNGSTWETLTDLDYKAKKLAFEVGWLPNNYMGKAWEKTWKVAYEAYQKELNLVLEEKEWKGISAKLQQFASYSTKSQPYKDMVAELESHVLTKKDLAESRRLLDELQKKQDEIEKKRGSGGTKAVTFKEEDYDQDRKDKALWTNKQVYEPGYGLVYDRTPADKYFRKYAEKNWASWSQEEKEVAYDYTSGSSYINEPLYTTYYSTKYGTDGKPRDSWTDINTLTRMIDKTPGFSRDVWLNRGDSHGGFLGQFGLNLNDYISNPDALVGREGVQAPFLSTAHTKGWGFVDSGKEPTRSVVYNIYCPKGTKGIYTEPYSAYGSGDYHWDGVTATKVQNEVEVILQRGTKLRITRAEYKNSTWIIDMEVIGQPSKKPNVI